MRQKYQIVCVSSSHLVQPQLGVNRDFTLLHTCKYRRLASLESPWPASRVMYYNILNAPQEVQLQILQSLDLSTLSKVCRVSKDLSARAIPELWPVIDFQRMKADTYHIEEIQREFLIVCDTLIGERPDRWRYLAAQIRILRFVKLSGVGIPWEANDWERSIWL